MSSTDPFGGLGFRGLGVWGFGGLLVLLVLLVLLWGGEGEGARGSVLKKL